MTYRKRIALRVVSAAAIVLWAAFIFGFSGQTGGESGGLSARVADVLVSVGDWFAGAVTAGEARNAAIEALQFPIRKVAHMSEYAVLALLVLAQLRLWPAFSGTGLSAQRAQATEPGALAEEGGPDSHEAAAWGNVSGPAPIGAPIDCARTQEASVCERATVSPVSPWDLYLSTLRKAALVAWGAATLYAATDEFHQLFVPGRAGLFTDVLIDATGAAIGLLLAGSIIALVKRPR